MGTTGSIARHGVAFRVERKGTEYLAKWISPVGVYPSEGSRDDVSEAALNAALQKGGWQSHETLPDRQYPLGSLLAKSRQVGHWPMVDELVYRCVLDLWPAAAVTLDRVQHCSYRK